MGENSLTLRYAGSEGVLERLDPGWLARLRVRLLITPESLLANRRTLGRRYPALVKLASIDSLPRIFLTLIKFSKSRIAVIDR